MITAKKSLGKVTLGKMYVVAYCQERKCVNMLND